MSQSDYRNKRKKWYQGKIWAINMFYAKWIELHPPVSPLALVYAGDDCFIMWSCKALKHRLLIFFFPLAYLILLLLSCITILICTDLLIPSITSQVKGAHNAWFPFSWPDCLHRFIFFFLRLLGPSRLSRRTREHIL